MPVMSVLTSSRDSTLGINFAFVMFACISCFCIRKSLKQVLNPILLISHMLIVSQIVINFKCVCGHTTDKYMTSTFATNYSNAETFCVTVYGAHLAIITGDAEETLVRQVASQDFINDDIYLWIGLNDRVSEDTWMWTDGTLVTETAYTNWISGEPSQSNQERQEDCVESRIGGWNDESCSVSRFFVCELSTFSPSLNPTQMPTSLSSYPSYHPTAQPTRLPTRSPSASTQVPTTNPSQVPSESPTHVRLVPSTAEPTERSRSMMTSTQAQQSDNSNKNRSDDDDDDDDMLHAPSAVVVIGSTLGGICLLTMCFAMFTKCKVTKALSEHGSTVDEVDIRIQTNPIKNKKMHMPNIEKSRDRVSSVMSSGSTTSATPATPDPSFPVEGNPVPVPAVVNLQVLYQGDMV